MTILPCWNEYFARPTPVPQRPNLASERPPLLPKAPEYYAGRITFVASADAAENMADLARQRPLSCIGFDTEFGYDRPGIRIDKDRFAHDPRSIRPLLMSLSLCEPDGAGRPRLSNFVVDLRRADVLEGVSAILRLPTPFVGHYAHAEMLCLLQLGLAEPCILWDTWVCEKALHLGDQHRRYRAVPNGDASDEAVAREVAEELERRRLSLAETCRRRGVPYPFAGDKRRLAESFLTHPGGADFTPEQIEYAAADAEAAALLYAPQVAEAARAGILQHLVQVEMPWVAANARITWHGLRVDGDKARAILRACDRHSSELGPRLAELGISSPRSSSQLREHFQRLDLIELFRRGDALCFDRERLDQFRHRHPSIGLIRAARRVDELRGDKILNGEFVGSDGRVHPDHRQLGTDTGRQSCRWPNAAGIGKVLRPLIVPDPGRGLGEADWSQIEVGIAAAVYGDEALMRQFNTGDVYSAMAQDFYRDRLGEPERSLPGEEFKRRHRELRDRMKTCTLGIIYGLTPRGLGLRLGIGTSEAAALQGRFMGMFPALRRGLSEAAGFGAIRGHAATTTGLRRLRAPGSGTPTNWERNWLANHPVQGTAACIFKSAGIRLDRLYRAHDAWIVLPMHDAFVFEAPLDRLAEVAALTDTVMSQVVREYFPGLDARVEINIDHPECWNKDGHINSLERWMEDPTYAL